MTEEIFVSTVMKLRKYIDQFDQVDDLLGMQWTEGVIGKMFDLFYDILIPGANDMVSEDFGEILFSSNVTEEDIEDFYEEYKESLD